MRVFVTGASGFIGSAIVRELIEAGHEVTGLARSKESAATIIHAGARVFEGSLDDLERLKRGAAEADGVIHSAFIHDFHNFAASVDADKKAIGALGSVLAGSGRPLVVAAGILGLRTDGNVITEADVSAGFPRASEIAAIALADANVRVSVIRLPPSVHDKGDHGFVPFIISMARKNGMSAYVGEGTNRWPAVHRLDAARLFRLALEKGTAGSRFNAIGDTGIPIRDIATVIGRHLNLPVVSIPAEAAAGHFDWMSRFILFDAPASGAGTEQALGWKPTHPGLIDDLNMGHYFGQ